MPANLENSAVATGLEKVSFHSNPNKGQCKECSNYRTVALISPASKVMLKIFQPRLQQYMSWELADFQPGFRKGRGSRDQIANMCWITEKARELKTNKQTPYLLLHWICYSLWLCESQQTGKFLKRWEYQTTLLASSETFMQVQKLQLEPDMEQPTRS